MGYIENTNQMEERSEWEKPRHLGTMPRWVKGGVAIRAEHSR